MPQGAMILGGPALVSPKVRPPYLYLMSIPVEKLTEEMLALPSEARALRADRLVESLDPLADDEVRAS
jgi:hypothetical protein